MVSSLPDSDDEDEGELQVDSEEEERHFFEMHLNEKPPVSTNTTTTNYLCCRNTIPTNQASQIAQHARSPGKTQDCTV